MSPGDAVSFPEPCIPFSLPPAHHSKDVEFPSQSAAGDPGLPVSMLPGISRLATAGAREESGAGMIRADGAGAALREMSRRCCCQVAPSSRRAGARGRKKAAKPGFSGLCGLKKTDYSSSKAPVYS